MRQAIIQLAPRRNLGHHPGVLLQRYLVPPDDESDKKKQEERRNLFESAIQAVGSDTLSALYADAFTRWNASFPENGLSRSRELRTTGRLIVGLGSENVLETGLRLHHTYGVPVVPGSALKGLAAHYCGDVWGQRGSAGAGEDNRPYERRGQFHDLVFGKTDEGGMITFHDAWITPESLSQGALRLDVMTPHHPNWQLGPDSPKFAPPTDFDSPVPVSFLSVSGAFLIHLSWNGPANTSPELVQRWTERTMEILTEALAEWGVGGKTSSGYGRLVPVASPDTSANQTSAGSAARPAEPIHGPRQKVTVTQRTIDGKVRYEADDGFLGSLLRGTPPAIADGESTEL